MDSETGRLVQDIIDHGKDLTLATVRPDGYPQATTVSYANDGLTIYVGVGKQSQKASNIRGNGKVSLTINAEYADWNHIKGVSMGGIAEIVEAPEEMQHARDCMLKRFPQLAQWDQAGQEDNIVFLKIAPHVISVLDYEKGFGHTDLVTV